MQRHNRRSRGLALAGSLLIGMAAVAGTVSAHSGHGHPTLIHEGTCDALGKVVYTLNGVGAAEDEHGTPIATPEAVNPRGAYQVMIGESEIDAKLDDLLAKPLAVMIYNDDESMQGIACGNLGGARLGDELIVGRNIVHQPAEARQHVDRGVVAARGQLSRQPGVPVKQPADSVADWFVGIVGLDQHRVERGNAAGGATASPLDELGEQREHRGGIAARGGGFTGGQTDFALSLGEAGERIHE